MRRSTVARWPVIYTTTNWWQQCTGNYDGGRRDEPALDRLLLARRSGSCRPAWKVRRLYWQWSNELVDFTGDQDVFNGS